MARIRAFLATLFSREELRLWLRLEDKRRRILLAVVLLLLGGYAGYQWLASHQKDRHYTAATQALERYDYDEASAHLKKSLAWRPTDAEVLLMAAQTARRRGLFEESLARLHQAEKSGADSDAVAGAKHLLSVHRGDLADRDGIKQLVLFCEDKPDSREAALILEAIIEGSMTAHAPPLAEWAVKLWLKHRPAKIDQAQGLVWRGRSTMAFGKSVPLPLDDFREAIELAPDHYQARLFLAAGMIGQEPKQAIPHLDWLRQRRPDDVAVRFQVARFQRNIGQAEEAGRLLDEIITLVANDKLPALVERANVAMDLHRPQEAERYLLQAQAIDPMHREVNNAMVECLRQMNRLEQAEKYLKSVRDYDEKMAKMKEQWEKKMGGGKEAKKS